MFFKRFCGVILSGMMLSCSCMAAPPRPPIPRRHDSQNTAMDIRIDNIIYSFGLRPSTETYKLIARDLCKSDLSLDELTRDERREQKALVEWFNRHKDKIDTKLKDLIFLQKISSTLSVYKSRLGELYGVDADGK